MNGISKEIKSNNRKEEEFIVNSTIITNSVSRNKCGEAWKSKARIQNGKYFTIAIQQ